MSKQFTFATPTREKLNRHFIHTRKFLSLLLTMAFCLSQFAGLAASRSWLENSGTGFSSSHHQAYTAKSPDTRKNVCSLIADTVEDDIHDPDAVNPGEKTSGLFVLNFTRFFDQASVACSKNRLHNHPFLESKPFRTLPVFLEIRVFRI